jgi:uncharacterized protein YndB with AHSA1/START domain
MTMSTTNTTTNMTADRIEKRVTLRAPQARVWRALANAEEFGSWFGFKLEGAFTPGKVMKGTFNGKLDENAIMEAQRSSGIEPSKLNVPDGNMTLFTVDRMEPERYFSFRWIPFGIDAEADPENEPMTLVEFQLEPVAEGTALTIVESGFERVPAHRRARAFRMNNGGWAAQAENLRKYVDGA